MPTAGRWVEPALKLLNFIGLVLLQVTVLRPHPPQEMVSKNFTMLEANIGY